MSKFDTENLEQAFGAFKGNIRAAIEKARGDKKNFAPPNPEFLKHTSEMAHNAKEAFLLSSEADFIAPKDVRGKALAISRRIESTGKIEDERGAVLDVLQTKAEIDAFLPKMMDLLKNILLFSRDLGDGSLSQIATSIHAELQEVLLAVEDAAEEIEEDEEEEE